MSRNRFLVALAALGVLGVGVSEAQGQWTRGETGCDEEWGSRDAERVCHVMEGTFADPGRLVVDGGMNGGVHIEGWNRDEVEVRAKVWANARSESRALEIADEIEVSLRNGRLSARGPDMRRREGWGVSWEVMVPRSTDLDVETFNGGISITEVDGRIDFEALNGGAHLNRLSGDVSGRTTNGGLHIELDGSSWSGEGMDVRTTNGGVTLTVPSGYSARLETGTVNGGIDLDFPVTIEGRISKRLSTVLGEGGPTIRAMTTNGGVRIRRSTRTIR